LIVELSDGLDDGIELGLVKSRASSLGISIRIVRSQHLRDGVINHPFKSSVHSSSIASTCSAAVQDHLLGKLLDALPGVCAPVYDLNNGN